MALARRAVPRFLFAATVSVVVVAIALPAQAVTVRDPDLFGSGEGWPAPRLIPGSHGVWVAELQQALEEAGFRPGDDDGRYGAATVAAVQTFQKLYGLEIDAVFKPEYWETLNEGVPPPGSNGERDRVEIDLARQVLFLVLDDEVDSVVPISTANGGRYVNFWGRLVTSYTPEGRFELYNRRYGWYESYLGHMYNPFYFNGGYAIHGSPHVPIYPASHGCVRVRVTDMNYLETTFDMGLPVYVYGSRLAREDVVPPDPVIPDLLATAARATS